MPRLLEGDTYFYMSYNDAALIRGQFLLNARRLSKETRYFYSQV